MTSMLIPLLDLDGTLYDSLLPAFNLENHLLVKRGHAPVSLGFYQRNLQSMDWRKLARDMGHPEEEVEEVVEEFGVEYEKLGPSSLIPGAREVVLEAELAGEGLYFVTNDTPERVRMKFERDGFVHLLGNVRSPVNGKAQQLYELAVEFGGRRVGYFGDMVCDGEEVLAAREMGAENLEFFAVTHEYAMNTPEMLREYVVRHADFAHEVESLARIPGLLRNGV